MGTFHANGNQKGVGIDRLHQTKQTLTPKLKQDTKIMVINDKGANSTRRYNKYKYIYTSEIVVPGYIKHILTDLKGK